MWGYFAWCCQGWCGPHKMQRLDVDSSDETTVLSNLPVIPRLSFLASGRHIYMHQQPLICTYSTQWWWTWPQEVCRSLGMDSISISYTTLKCLALAWQWPKVLNPLLRDISMDIMLWRTWRDGHCGNTRHPPANSGSSIYTCNLDGNFNSTCTSSLPIASTKNATIHAGPLFEVEIQQCFDRTRSHLRFHILDAFTGAINQPLSQMKWLDYMSSEHHYIMLVALLS